MVTMMMMTSRMVTLIQKTRRMTMELLFMQLLTSSAIGSASSYWFSELAGTSLNFTKALMVFIVSKFYLLYLEATTRTRSNQCDLLPYIVSQSTYHVLELSKCW